MADVNDDATNELIARMLAEDNNYAAAYAQPSDVSEDSDYDHVPKKRAKKGKFLSSNTNALLRLESAPRVLSELSKAAERILV